MSSQGTRALFEAWLRDRTLPVPDHPAHDDFTRWLSGIDPQLPLPSYDEFEAWYREAAARRAPRPGGAEPPRDET
jgi:hypothetical protein